MSLTYYTPSEPIEVVCKSCGSTQTAERFEFPDVLVPINSVECDTCDWCKCVRCDENHWDTSRPRVPPCPIPHIPWPPEGP